MYCLSYRHKSWRVYDSTSMSLKLTTMRSTAALRGARLQNTFLRSAGTRRVWRCAPQRSKTDMLHLKQTLWTAGGNAIRTGSIISRFPKSAATSETTTKRAQSTYFQPPDPPSKRLFRFLWRSLLYLGATFTFTFTFGLGLGVIILIWLR